MLLLDAGARASHAPKAGGGEAEGRVERDWKRGRFCRPPLPLHYLVPVMSWLCLQRGPGLGPTATLPGGMGGMPHPPSQRAPTTHC